MSEIKNTLVAHIEQQVEHTEIGQKPMTPTIHLVILLGSKMFIRQGATRTDDITIVVGLSEAQIARRPIVVSRRDMRLNVEQLAHLGANLHIEIIKIGPLLFKERAQVIRIIFKKRRFDVCTLQGIPVKMPPVAMIADAHILYHAFLQRLSVVLLHAFHGHSECLQTIGSGNDTTVAIGLLDETIVTLNHDMAIAVQFLIPLHRTEISH